MYKRKKLTMKSADLIQINIAKLAQLFPNVITEVKDKSGRLKKAVDFELLKQELSAEIVEGEKERYQLTWPGKKEALLHANTPIEKTLRPVKEDSVDWDNTQNLYIEGDNLEVLKLLQDSYLNKVKCIYIDPPYNTGKDFIYKDDFRQTPSEYLSESGQVDEEGNRLFQNNESNGRFHSDWLSMMYSRLKLARSLLRDDGVIFISIDNNEAANLKKICDEIFSESNFIEQIPWIKRVSPANDSQWYSGDHEFVLIYAKHKNNWFPKRTQRTAEHDKYYKNTDNDPRGPWNSAAYTCNKSRSERPNLYYAIVNPNTGEEIYPDENAVWAYSNETHIENVKNRLLYWGADGSSKSPRKKQFLTEAKDVVARSHWHYTEVGSTQTATTELRNLFDGASFSYPKPVRLLKKIIYQTTNPDQNEIILDFFSGSATTAHAVMLLNAKDGGTRKYIMVQLQEPTPKDSEAYKAGYKNICEIGKERIRRAAKKIKEETNVDIDYGFRVFRVDSTNMKDVYYSPEELQKDDLFSQIDNIKDDRGGEDLLIQVMLECGLELSLPMETREIHGKKVHFVAGNSLVACFDEEVPEKAIKQIAKDKPLRIVFRDRSFATDSNRINLEEIFKMVSPSTEIKVI
ncbi:MAG: site-specific DNA-methyltransferase [Desulfosporosinus sp.]